MRILLNEIAREFSPWGKTNHEIAKEKPYTGDKPVKADVVPAQMMDFCMYICPTCGTELLALWKITASKVECSEMSDIKRGWCGFNGVCHYKQNCHKYEIEKMNYQLPEYMAARKEKKKLLTMNNCPICGGTLSHSVDDGFFFDPENYDLYNKYLRSCEDEKGRKYTLEEWKWAEGLKLDMYKSFAYDSDKPDFKCSLDILKDEIVRDCDKTIQDGFACLAGLREAKEKPLAESAAEKTLQKLDHPMSKLSSEASAGIKNDPEKLKEYLSELTQLEGNVYLLSQRLASLYYQLQTTEKTCLAERKYPAYQFKMDAAKNNLIVKALKDEWLQLLQELKTTKEKPVGEFIVTQLIIPQEPKEPVLETPGLFNKKRVLAENNEAKAKYDEEMDKYRKKVAFYQDEQRRKKEKIILDLETKTEDARKKWDKASQDAEACVNNYQPIDKGIELPSGVLKSALEDEISKVEKLLEDTLKCRNELYAFDIIFPKYRNLVALTTMNEYLITGRCEKLEGPGGAYNLYESELRANMIISQLSQIIDSLEQIKQNQYLLYNEMKQINATLSSMDDSLNNAVKSLSNIDSASRTIAKNTGIIAENSALIEYNTAKTALYSQKTAELTKAIGYLVALK